MQVIGVAVRVFVPRRARKAGVVHTDTITRIRKTKVASRATRSRTDVPLTRADSLLNRVLLAWEADSWVPTNRPGFAV